MSEDVLDRKPWTTGKKLRLAIITWIERTYYRRRVDAPSEAHPDRVRPWPASERGTLVASVGYATMCLVGRVIATVVALRVLREARQEATNETDAATALP